LPCYEFEIVTFQKIVFWISFVGLLAIIFDFGFPISEQVHWFLDAFYFLVLGIGVVMTGTRYFQNFRRIKRKVFVFDTLSVLFTGWVIYLYLFIGTPFETDFLLENPVWVKLAVFLTFVREFSEQKVDISQTVLNLAQLFILSFLVIIVLGSLLLLLPNATHDHISFLDALFTSTSAVCVTGLVVVDTATHFTVFGHFIIMTLIQIGGLGILTFASYFSYFFKGGSTYKNQLILSDLTSSKKLGEVFSMLKYILLITFGIELMAAELIYFSLDAAQFDGEMEYLFFASFHAISAFCNAGFSTLSSSLYDEGFRFNYLLQVIIIITFVFGGLGFPIVVNALKYLKYKLSTLLKISSKHIIYWPWVLNINSRITLMTTFLITFIGFFLFYFLEYNNTLAEHNGWGKIVTALFGATTPRTAGFNTIDTASMTFPTTMIVFLMMWIGASPQSTGGGIKTSTFALAVLNVVSLAKGKTRIEIFRREIAPVSVQRAFAIITLSLFVISLAIMFISIFDPEKKMFDIEFECFSE